ncbi:ribosome-associated protein [Neisseria perflava]|uniref:ribosome biogenesis factor YjgA n=1 Tax=Neisseria perflava TaxID=33053 RepID=UPI00209E5342|nr:ribosome biogenesis factor YjgA [Neisseria perflava]MCP1772548.1 ribosome-associated protein [Neisseria perflava]
MFEQEDEWVSKTRMKKQMDDLQDLGMALTKLSTDTLKKIGLSEDLFEAVQTYKKITSNSALKRQAQFIGRLMRDTDPEPIERYLAKLRGDNAAHNAFLQRVEQAREHLIAGDDALTAFIADYPHADAGKLRTLIRNTRKEQAQSKPPKNFRALFQEIKAVMEGNQSGGDEAFSEEAGE